MYSSRLFVLARTMLQGPLFWREDPEPQKRYEKTYVVEICCATLVWKMRLHRRCSVASGIYIWQDGPERDGLSRHIFIREEFFRRCSTYICTYSSLYHSYVAWQILRINDQLCATWRHYNCNIFSRWQTLFQEDCYENDSAESTHLFWQTTRLSKNIIETGTRSCILMKQINFI